MCIDKNTARDTFCLYGICAHQKNLLSFLPPPPPAPSWAAFCADSVRSNAVTDSLDDHEK